MAYNRKNKGEKYVIIYDDFREQGLTLVKAYILGRVSRFNNVGSPYYESNKTLSKAMGISESTVKRAIDELVKEGKLYKKTLPRKRLLSIKPFNYEGHGEPLVEGHGEPHENNNGVGQTPKGFMVNCKGVHGEPHERFMVNHYKIEDKIEDKEEKTQKPKLTEEEALDNKLPNNENIVLTEEQKRIKEEIERIGRGY